MSLAGKTLFITGGSRGIGLAIALRAARDGANVVIAAKTTTPHLPHLRLAANPHILALSPPLAMRPDWFAPHLAYTMSKYGMSMVMLGLAEELRGDGIACNSLWPRTTIATAAIEFALGGSEMMRRSRNPEIMADAAHWLLSQPARELSGCFLLDEECLARAGITNFDDYAVAPGQSLRPTYLSPGDWQLPFCRSIRCCNRSFDRLGVRRHAKNRLFDHAIAEWLQLV